jgi:hypothetical protein
MDEGEAWHVVKKRGATARLVDLFAFGMVIMVVLWVASNTDAESIRQFRQVVRLHRLRLS